MSYLGPPPLYAIVIPVHNEGACLRCVLDELQPHADEIGAVIAVGLNACNDDSEEIAARHGVLVGKTHQRGYGHGCLAAMDAISQAGLRPAGWIFMAGDGANDPRDLKRFTQTCESGSDLVLGQRTSKFANWRALGFTRATANVVLGIWAGILGKRLYADLGPYRLISGGLVGRLPFHEKTWGWTIEPQILAPLLGANIKTLTVSERQRLGGEQKISQVSLKQSIQIAWAISTAGWRVRKCFQRHKARIKTKPLSLGNTTTP